MIKSELIVSQTNRIPGKAMTMCWMIELIGSTVVFVDKWMLFNNKIKLTKN